MYIEEIVLEGFKSYATRTVISGWDPEFNAITGLNGSGKSNILDAICFVLGINNMGQVRATTLQDLVYKRGQSGITKASVTLVFNNTDTQKSPVGYTDTPQITITRQIILGGKNRYLINGHIAQQKQVDTLFHSVQLNVNNPHFLIMQGQITKVLNMRPPEILAMVEESAGTRMFEDRKEKALVTLEKKEAKVQEINGLLGELIDPKLAQLRSQRHEFVEFKQAEAELERSRRIIVAADYLSSKDRLASARESLQELQTEIENLTAQELSYKDELRQCEKKAEEITRKRQRGLKNAEKVKKLDDDVSNLEREKTRLGTQLQLIQQSQEEERRQLIHLQQLEQSLSTSLEAKRRELEEGEHTCSELSKQLALTKEQLSRDEELLHSLTSDDSMQGASNAFVKAINELKDKNVNLTVELEGLKMKMETAQIKVRQDKPQLEKAQKDCSGVVKTIDSLQKEILKLQAKYDSLPFVDSNNEYGSLSRERKRLEGELVEISEAVRSLRSQVSHAIKFDYSLPAGVSIDPTKIKGVVASLVELPQAHANYSTALEVAAGGRLYNVVVDDDRTARTLLEQGRLSKRVTIIPLNRIQARDISGDKIRAAEKACNGRARLALSLVGYEEEVEAAIRYVLGGTFICDDRESANRVTFDRNIGVRSVTVDGDLYEPSGTLTGGSSPSAASLLEKLSTLSSKVAEERDHQLQLDIVLEKLEKIDDAKAKAEELSQSIELKQHELSLLQQQLEQNASNKLIANVHHLESQLAALKERALQLTRQKTANEAEIKRIESDKSELASSKNKEKLKEFEKRVAALRKSFKAEDSQHRKAVSAMELSNAQCIKINNELKEAQTNAEECRQSLGNSERSLDELTNSLDAVKESLRDLSKKLDSELSHIRQFDAELKDVEERRAFMQESYEKAAIERKQAQSQLQRQQDVLEREQRELEGTLERHPWIADQAHLFGAPDGPFDFDRMGDMSEMRRKLKVLEEQHATQGRTVNVNVVDMIDRVESKEASLKQMLSTVKKDKVKIEDTINKLEDYKIEALERTWKQVNEDFGTIFAELLPGSFARLDKPEGAGSLADAGLEIRVRLGGVWKESLSELSGGQRSLIALSLILALLRHKPAPLYVLDEVDAALDPSHTQNIGRILLSPRFHGAQFIIVSLKEGMFGNANVLFRTRFKDGVSSIDKVEAKAEANSGEADSISKAKSKRPGRMTAAKQDKIAV